MNKLIAPLASRSDSVLTTSGAPVAAVEMQPGMWRFTQQTEAGGRAKVKAQARWRLSRAGQGPGALLHAGRRRLRAALAFHLRRPHLIEFALHQRPAPPLTSSRPSRSTARRISPSRRP